MSLAPRVSRNIFSVFSSRVIGCADTNSAALDLFAEVPRLAHDALSEVTGAFTSDDLLGESFGSFCIGKQPSHQRQLKAVTVLMGAKARPPP